MQIVLLRIHRSYSAFSGTICVHWFDNPFLNAPLNALKEKEKKHNKPHNPERWDMSHFAFCLKPFS